VRVLLNHSEEERKIPALLLVQRVAGSLPGFVPGNIRFRLTLEWIVQRLLQAPVSLVGAYMLSFLGATLGVGLQVYLTYNLPDILDVARITTSVEQGLIVGAIFGLGIFIVRVVMERFQTSTNLPKILLGTFIGGLMMHIAMLIFHVLFLNTPPKGFLILTACLFIALVFAAGGFLPSRLLRMFLSSGAVFGAILGTWLIHTRYSVSLVDLTPLFRFAYTWSLLQISLTALGVALPIGILGNLVNLSITEE